jgi:hypothetical protein
MCKVIALMQAFAFGQFTLYLNICFIGLDAVFSKNCSAISDSVQHTTSVAYFSWS